MTCMTPSNAPIPDSRLLEYDGLVRLLMAHASPSAHDAGEVARRIAAASLGEQHLWRDMGLGSREELRQLIESRFPALAAKNTKDMRWKRFFYKQLCGWSGFDA